MENFPKNVTQAEKLFIIRKVPQFANEYGGLIFASDSEEERDREFTAREKKSDPIRESTSYATTGDYNITETITPENPMWAKAVEYASY